MHAPTSDSQIKQALTEARTIAVVGISKNPARPSHGVARYLHERGHQIIPINPAYVGQELFGSPVLASLADIPKDRPVQMVDVFRRAEFVPQIVDQALEYLPPHLKTIWLQIGIFHEQALAKARAQGVATVQNRCPKIEYPRLFS